MLWCALMSTFLLPVHAALTWNSGSWNTTDSSWLDAGTPAVFSNGEAVEFTAAAAGLMVTITEAVEPASVVVSAPGFTFTGGGSIGGAASLTLSTGATLSVENANTFTGGTLVDAGAVLTVGQYNSLGTSNSGESALGAISGAGELIISLAAPDSSASIVGDSLSNFTGSLYVEQGNLGLGRNPSHGGPGWSASLGASQVMVGANSSFTISLGSGSAQLQTGNVFSSDVKTESGAQIGNRDGHVNWTGNVYLNLSDVTSDELVYIDTASTTMALYYGKYVVWNGIVQGDGVLAFSATNVDTGSDHRLVLANDNNTFSGAYHVRGEYLSTLALAAEHAAASADVQLDSSNSRLMLMGTDAIIGELNGPAGSVLAEGPGTWSLSVTGGNFSGNVQDSAGGASGVSLGITKTGSGNLTLNGLNCTYTGATSVQEGSLYFTGDVSLGNINMSSGASLTTEGNLTLRTGASLAFDMENSPGAAIQAGGALLLSGSTHSVSVSGYESLGYGSYDLITWTGSSTVESSSFLPTGLNDTDEYVYSLAVQGNALQLVVADMSSVAWLWNGGSATWEDDSATVWNNADAAGPAGQKVTFSSINPGTVTINRVTPSGINVLGGQYTFVAESDSSAGIVSSGVLTISGESTVLNLALNNESFTGNVVLQGGILEISEEKALGSSALYFNGGMIRYGAGITTDLSAALHADSNFAVRIDTNGNDVSWQSADGVAQALSCGVEKNGEGVLSLSWVAAGDIRTGSLTVNGGTLSIQKTSGSGTLAGVMAGSGEIALTSTSGQLTVSGDNGGFVGTLSLAGDGTANNGSVCFDSADSFGGADTLVRLAGQRFWFRRNAVAAANLEIVDSTITYMDGSTGNSYAFTGTVSGGGELRIVPSCFISMSGSISEYTGTFVHPGSTAVTWLLGGENVSGDGLVQANLDSPGTAMVYSFWYSAPTTMSGVISGAAALRQQGSGALILTGQNTTTGALIIDDGCTVQLGSADSSATWAGDSCQGTGQLILVNGSLSVPFSTLEGTVLADVAENGVVDIGGMDGNVLQSITVNEGGVLRGCAGDLLVGTVGGVQSLTLTPAASNIGASSTLSAGEQVMLEIQDGDLQIFDSASISLDMESVKSILEGKRQAVYIHISNADIVLQNGVTADSLFENSATSPAALGLVVLGVQDGNIVLEGDVRDVYMVTENGDYDTVTSYTRLQPYKATFVDSGYTLSLNLPGDNTQVAWVNNLLGGGNLRVSNTDESSGVVRVLLNNEVLASVDGVLTPGLDNQINTANTELQGNISAGNAVQLVKTGSGTFTLRGSLVADWFEIDEGTVQLDGAGSVVNSLHGDGDLLLNGALEITGNSTGFSGSINGSGSLELNGVLAVKASVGTLSGSGELRAAGGGFLVANTASATFSGSLAAGEGNGVLTVMRGAGTFELNRVQYSPSWSIRNAGSIIFNQAAVESNSVLTLQSLELQDGSFTTIVLNTDRVSEVFSLQRLQVADGALVRMESTGLLPVELSDAGTLVMGVAESSDLGNDGKVPLTLGSGTAFRGIEAAWLSVQNGLVLFNVERNNTDVYLPLAKSENAKTGAHMMWQLPNSVLRNSPDLTSLTNALDAAAAAAPASVDRTLAAAAGAGAAALGVAVMGDMERQLKAIRNRTTSMGLDPQYEYDELPLFNAWVNAEGDRRELKSDGSYPGYTLNSWGATVGCDWDFSTSFTAGLAFTGMYGDFQGKSPDHAEGDVDNYYLTLFGRYAVNRWTHTFIGAMGWSDISLKRRVSFTDGGYHTKGSTDGTSFGLLYELGYVIPLDEDMQSCLQPVANISYRHASVDSYSEHGSDAALNFDSQSMNVVGFGLGLRAQTYALENSLNRKALLEGRALLKADAGDRCSDTSVSLQALRSRGGRIRSAETGRVGMEMGAGISIPVGPNAGFIFLDAGLEFRADETEVNGTVGYRMTF